MNCAQYEELKEKYEDRAEFKLFSDLIYHFCYSCGPDFIREAVEFGIYEYEFNHHGRESSE